jgi:hypothetical protein
MSNDFLNTLRQNKYELVLNHLINNENSWTHCSSLLHRSRDYINRSGVILRTKCKDCLYELPVKYILRGPENTVHSHVDKLSLFRSLIDDKMLLMVHFTDEQLNIKFRDHGNYEYNQEICKILLNNMPAERMKLFTETIKNCDAKSEWKEELFSIIKNKNDVANDKKEN